MNHGFGSCEVQTISAAIIWPKELRWNSCVGKQAVFQGFGSCLGSVWRPQEWTALPDNAMDQADLLVFCLPHLSL